MILTIMESAEKASSQVALPDVPQDKHDAQETSFAFSVHLETCVGQDASLDIETQRLVRQKRRRTR